MDVSAELRTAGVVLLEGRSGIGSLSGAAGVEVRITETPKSDDGADEVNDVVMPNRGMFYVERNGRVWKLRDGPDAGENAVIWVGAFAEQHITPEQLDAVAVVQAVLSAAIGDAPSPPSTEDTEALEGSTDTSPGDSGDDPQEEIEDEPEADPEN